MPSSEGILLNSLFDTLQLTIPESFLAQMKKSMAKKIQPHGEEFKTLVDILEHCAKRVETLKEWADSYPQLGTVIVDTVRLTETLIGGIHGIMDSGFERPTKEQQRDIERSYKIFNAKYEKVKRIIEREKKK